MSRQLLVIASAALLAFSCGRSETMASKSAAAYRDAVAKGTPISGGGHDHHGAAEPSSADHAAHNASAGTGAMDHDAAGHEGMDHSTMQQDAAAHAGMDHSTMPQMAAGHANMDHGAMQHTTTDHAAMDHSAMQHTTTGHAAMDHSAMQHDTGAQAGMDHSAMQHGSMQHSAMEPGSAHAGHAMPSAPAARLPLESPSTNADIAKTDPARTLQADPLDAPASSSVSESAKASGGGPEGHSATPQAGLYSCPMHPEVTSDKPGTCPKCGMTLVKKES